MKFCPVCGHENSDNATRCTNPDCGYEFYTNSDNHKTRLMDGAGLELEQGSLISGRYEIIKELGRGGMGVVYLVKDAKLRGREVALKMIHPELISHEEARQRFIDEVLLCLDLHHPNIVIVYPIEETDRNLFFTMEYIQGQSLRKLMKDRQDRVPPFTLEEACYVVTQILDALEYAHQTTIHRDIKPENILVQGQFPDVQVKVLDFGIAKVLSASRFTRTAQSMGTAYYMSPEQMQGGKSIDMRSDLYSVGMIFYEMLTGVIAAGRFELPGEIIKGLPPELDKLIEHVLSPRPEIRFDSARSMKQALLPMPESARKIATENLNSAVMALLSKAAFKEARETIKTSGITETVLFDKIQETQKKYNAYMDQGKRLLSSGDIESARVYLDKAAVLCPGNGGLAELKTKLVEIEKDLKEKHAAEKKEKAEKLKEEQRINALRREKESTREKERQAREHIEKTEKQYDTYIENIREAMASQNYSQAETNINKALEICPDSSKVGELKKELESINPVSNKQKLVVRLFLIFLIIGIGGYFAVTQSSKHLPISAAPAASKLEKQTPIAVKSPGEKQSLAHDDADAPSGTAMAGYPVVKAIQVKNNPFSVMVNMTGKAPVKILRIGEREVLVAIKNVSLAKGLVIGGKENPNLESVHLETLEGNLVALMVTGKNAFEEKIKSSFNASNNQLTVILNKAVKPVSPVPKSGKQALVPATEPTDAEKIEIYEMIKSRFTEDVYARIAMMRLAEIYQKNGEYERCIEEIEELLSTHPGSSRYEAVKLMQKAYDALFKEQLKADEKKIGSNLDY